MHTSRMRVQKYLPAKLYGFCHDLFTQVFFYLSVFHAEKRSGEKFVPPIPGELVDVTFIPSESPGTTAPRAQRVVRIETPIPKTGIVDGFDAERGYGFIKGDDAHDYYLHRSEVQDGRLPLKGQRVMFYAVFVDGGTRSRACYITIL